MEKRVKPHYYHLFQHNYASPRFHGLSATVGEMPVQYLVRTLLHDLALEPDAVPHDAGTVAGALARWANICATGLKALRLHVEDVFDQMIEEYARDGKHFSQEELMVLTGMVGQFGVTSSERDNSTAVTNHGYPCKIV